MNITDHADGQPAGMVQRSTQNGLRTLPPCEYPESVTPM